MAERRASPSTHTEVKYVYPDAVQIDRATTILMGVGAGVATLAIIKGKEGLSIIGVSLVSLGTVLKLLNRYIEQ